MRGERIEESQMPLLACLGARREHKYKVGEATEVRLVKRVRHLCRRVDWMGWG